MRLAGVAFTPWEGEEIAMVGPKVRPQVTRRIDAQWGRRKPQEALRRQEGVKRCSARVLNRCPFGISRLIRCFPLLLSPALQKNLPDFLHADFLYKARLLRGILELIISKVVTDPVLTAAEGECKLARNGR